MFPRAQSHVGHLHEEDLMFDTMSFAELDGQHVELLAARTVLSMFSVSDAGAAPGAFAPDQLARGVMGFLIAGSSNPGADGSSGGGNNGASNS
jgi:hypothetical protein